VELLSDTPPEGEEFTTIVKDQFDYSVVLEPTTAENLDDFEPIEDQD